MFPLNKTVKLLLIGLLPLPLGYALNLLPLALSSAGWSILLLAMLPLWFAAGYATLGTGERVWKNTLLAHLPALGFLLLALVQLLIRRAWLPGPVGALSQHFFAPFLLPAFTLDALLPAHEALWPAFVLAFAIMAALFSLGARVKIARARHRQSGGN